MKKNKEIDADMDLDLDGDGDVSDEEVRQVLDKLGIRLNHKEKGSVEIYSINCPTCAMLNTLKSTKEIPKIPIETPFGFVVAKNLKVQGYPSIVTWGPEDEDNTICVFDSFKEESSNKPSAIFKCKDFEGKPAKDLKLED